MLGGNGGQTPFQSPLWFNKTVVLDLTFYRFAREKTLTGKRLPSTCDTVNAHFS
jgi:hypothetical protein